MKISSVRGVLARLNPKTPHLNGVGGGTPELLICEMAGALPTDLLQRTALLTKCAGWPREELVVLLLLRRAVDLSVANGWKLKGVSLKGMCEAIVAEWLSPPVCVDCSATGKARATNEDIAAEESPVKKAKMQQTREKPCPRCHGRGFLRRDGQSKADAIGVPRETWRRTWAKRYDAVMAVLEQAEANGLRYMARRLG